MTLTLSFLKLLLLELTCMCVCWQGLTDTLEAQYEFEFICNGLRNETKSAWKRLMIGREFVLLRKKRLFLISSFQAYHTFFLKNILSAHINLIIQANGFHCDI